MPFEYVKKYFKKNTQSIDFQQITFFEFLRELFKKFGQLFKK